MPTEEHPQYQTATDEGKMTIAKLGASVVVCYLLIMLTQFLMKSSDKPGELAERLIDKMTTGQKDIAKENNDAHKEVVKEFKTELHDRDMVTREWMKVQGDRNASENEKTRRENAEMNERVMKSSADLHERQIKILTDIKTGLDKKQ